MSQLLHLASHLLQLDVALPWNLYDEAGHMLLSRGFVLVRDAQIDALIERGVFVRPEDLKLYHYPGQAPIGAAPPPPPKQIDPFNAREAMSGRLALLLRDAAHESATGTSVEEAPHEATGAKDFTAKIREVAGMIHLVCDTCLDGTLAGIFLLDHTKYPISHSLDTAILVDLLARRMDWPEARRRSAVCAALTMNIGMIDAQTIMTLQRMPLTEVQRKTVADHPALGAKILRDVGVTDELWLRIVEDHHEVPDGSGYPAGKKEIDEDTLLVRTLDIFTALVTPRATRAALDPAQAARTLFVQENKYGNKLVGLLIKEVGLHPPGSYAKLKNGDIAVVSKHATATSPMLVHSFINGKGLPMLEPMWRDTSKPEFGIAAAIARDAVTTKTDLLKIWHAPAKA